MPPKKIKDPNDDQNGFMLYMLYFLIHNLRNVSVGKYELEDMLLNVAEGIMTPAGKKTFLNGEMESVINKENIDKYRNPPSHTRYLSYDIASECRKYVLGKLETIESWFCKE